LVSTIGGQLGFTIENARLFEESRKFRLGLERSADAVFMTDVEGTIVYANPAFEKIYGFSLDEVIGANPRIIKSGVIPREQYKEFWETLLNKGTISGEIVNKTKDGRLIPIEGTNSPILDEDGNILGFLAIHTDITQRKEDEEALNRRNEYLAASAEIGRLVTSTLDLEAIYERAVNLVVERFGFYHASIFINDELGINAYLQEATGAAGQKMKDRKHFLPIGSRSTVGEATRSGEVVVVNNTTLDSFHRPNPLLPETKAEAAIPLRIGNRIIGALDIQSTEVDAFSEDDIAILQLLTDQISVGIDNARSYNLAQQAVEEMREVDRLKSQFLANMSHELRTPLNSIIGFARVILKGIDGPITDLQQQDLTAIFNSGQHLLGLINDVLDLSRIEAGKMDLTFDEVNITDLIGSVMSTAAGLVKDKPVNMVSAVAENLPMVKADAMRIRQVLINFISNAAKFTEEGEIIIKADLEESDKGQPEVMIKVIDSGPGIAKEDQAKLFQAFSQVDASLTRKVGGSGLGLSICHHLIQMHNGQIGVQSALGEGSTFYFSIPILQNKAKAEENNGKQVILAIDDDPQIISLYERYLEPKGFQVIGLTDPAKARQRVEELKPFAITLDIMMPGYEGWQVLTDLKSSPETRDTPVVVCSIVEDEEKGFSLGAADYLVKPIHEDDLLASLDRLNGDGSIREVLVIDDDPNDLRLLGKMLSEQGKYKAILAEGGPAGWNAIKSQAPHAVVLDLFMPEMDGFTILEQMRNDKNLRNKPVIVITGADLNSDQQKQLDNLGQRLLQKSSLKEKDLITTIEDALHRVKVS
jgi:PAS domain S-box-containing protein